MLQWFSIQILTIFASFPSYAISECAFTIQQLFSHKSLQEGSYWHMTIGDDMEMGGKILGRMGNCGALNQKAKIL